MFCCYYSYSYFFRILISCINFLSNCMCPRCLSLKQNITQVASKIDMCNRVKLARVVSEASRYNVEQVRKLLFEKGLAITSVFVNRILEATSGMPTRVCVPLYLSGIVFWYYFMINKIRTHFWNFQIGSIDLNSILWTSCSRSPARVWARSLESDLRSFNLHSVCFWSRHYLSVELEACSIS